jgi:hypothetical protein
MPRALSEREKAMVESLSRSDADPGLRELLVARARHASDGRLVSDVIGGALVASIVLLWRPAGWLPLLSAACCFAAFGAWGISDRVLREQAAPGRWTRVLAIARTAAAVLGAAAGVSLLFSLWGLALGTWIS